MAILHLIGSGTPTPTESRFGTCFVLDLDGELLMFDCGPASTWKLVRAGLWPTKIEHLFFTHHHFDHDVDYPCFLLVRWDQSTGGETTLKVFGPPPTKLMTDRLIGPEGAFVQDWKARCGHSLSQFTHKNRGGSLPRPEPRVEAKDIGPGLVLKNDRWKITAAVGRHVEPFLVSLAYRIDTPTLSVVIAGDTAPCETVAKLSKGCDVLVLDAWDLQSEMERNGEKGGMVGTRDAGEMARDAGAKKLIVTHQKKAITSGAGKKQTLADIAASFAGEVVFGEEMMKIEL